MKRRNPHVRRRKQSVGQRKRAPRSWNLAFGTWSEPGRGLVRKKPGDQGPLRIVPHGQYE